jgi:hypothetical protein
VSRPTLTLLRIADPPESWTALGFEVNENSLHLGGVRVELGAEGDGGIVSWGLQGIDGEKSIDGLPTAATQASASAEAIHPNGALSIDHVVVTTPDFERTSAVLAEAGLDLRRVREAPGGVRQGFRRLGPAILELVEVPGADDPAAPARFWGLVITVPDLDVLSDRLGDRLGHAKPAVQPGRRIATLRSCAGVGPAMAFMTPEPPD